MQVLKGLVRKRIEPERLRTFMYQIAEMVRHNLSNVCCRERNGKLRNDCVGAAKKLPRVCKVMVWLTLDSPFKACC